MERKKNILIVDDHKATGQILELTIANIDEAYDVVCVRDGYHALDLVRQTPFDLVVTDYNMPDIDGLELRESIQALSPHTEVVIVSAMQKAEIAKAFAEMNAENFLPKPFTFDQVQGVVKNALAKVEAARAAGNAPRAVNRPDTSEIKNHLHHLCQDTRAFCCFLAETNGFLIAHAGGDDQIPLQMLASLTAANALATIEIANLLGNTNPFKTIIHEGDDYNVACYLLENNTLLVIVFSKQTRIGVVQHYARQMIGILSAYDMTPTPHPATESFITENLLSGVDGAFDDLLLDDS